MRLYICILSLLLCISVTARGQEFIAKSLIKASTSLPVDAERRADQNNEMCALLVVVMQEKDVMFSGGYMLGNATEKEMEYYVYMAKGAKKLTIVKNGFLPYTCVFEDFGIKSLEPNQVYKLTIEMVDNIQEVSGSIEGHYYVDMGLSVKWATCNVGANKIGDLGNYYLMDIDGSRFYLTNESNESLDESVS